MNNRIKNLCEIYASVFIMPFHKQKCQGQANNCVENLNLGVILIMLIGILQTVEITYQNVNSLSINLKIQMQTTNMEGAQMYVLLDQTCVVAKVVALNQEQERERERGCVHFLGFLKEQ